MKILFIPYTGSLLRKSETSFNLHFIKYLSSLHSLSVVCGSHNEIIRSTTGSLGVPTHSRAILNHKEWDIIIVQDVIALKRIHRAADRASIPILFIASDDVWIFQPFMCDNLMGIVRLYSNNSTLPALSEITCNIRKPLCISNTGKTKLNSIVNGIRPEKQVIHIYNRSDDDLRIVKILISCFNLKPDFNLTIVVPKTVVFLLRKLVNENIAVSNEDEFDKIPLSEYDLAVGSDGFARESLFFGVPTILVGQRGIGGLVTSSNIYDHLEHHFDGRLGGELNELIPPLLLNEELNFFAREQLNVLTDTQLVSSIIKQFHDANHAFSSIENEIGKAVSLFSKLHSKNHCSLKPCKVENIKTVTEHNGDVVLFAGNGRVIGAVSASENSMLEKCTGEWTIEQIAHQCNTREEAIKGFIDLLWKENVIFFKDEC